VVEYLVEVFQPKLTAAERAAASAQARRAAEQQSQAGTPVRYLRSIFVPEDEVLFHLFEGGSADAVRQAMARAELPYERVVEAIDTKGRL
jgi:hypothetical protein